MEIVTVILAIISTIILIFEIVHNEHKTMKVVKRKDRFSGSSVGIELFLVGVMVWIPFIGVLIWEENDKSPLQIFMYVMCYVISVGAIIFSIKNHNRYQNIVTFENEYIYHIYNHEKILYEEIQFVCISSAGTLGTYIINVYINNKKYALKVSSKEYEKLKTRLNAEALRISEKLDDSSTWIDKLCAGSFVVIIAGLMVIIFLASLDKISGSVFEIGIIVIIISAGVLFVLMYIHSNRMEKEMLKYLMQKKEV